MSWNWGVFLKSWLFGFLGFLIGIVSTVIYLAVDVDLSKLDGLFIVTGVLIAITIWYAYTKKSLEINETLMKLIINHYIPFVIIVLAVLTYIAFLFMGTQYNDIATNLVAEGIGVLITVILLLYLLNLKEEFRWKKVENRVHKQLEKQIYGIYIEFSNLCVTNEPLLEEGEDKDIHVNFEKEMYRNLKELKNIDKITIDIDVKESLKKGTYSDLFNYRNNYLKYILSTFFNFLDPSIDKSLIIIQDALESICLDVDIMKKQKEEEEVLYKWFKNDDLFFNHIEQSMVKIFTEIESLHDESNLKIYCG